ncbi:hypothetical protein [Cellulophaga omnivescoria]|uniref:hypothetical protein n=1 Tax=Cellulophaga omnivescoria TaxID=1888890 RepID=UPI0022F13DCE|nr:hypothetical protein [Cellulophaga omnivescoria]WBU88495.1 hypothetical protein PBN93_11500 [Cellulophaga omnivescoria]WKB80474.1 hypothetical protein QYR09_12010 [Cellulophaga lytica]
MTLIDNLLENIAEPFYAITLVIALWRYPNYYNTYLKYFPILIAYTLLNEVLGFLISSYPDLFNISINKFYTKNNILLYNIYDIIYFLYFLYIYKLYLEKKILKIVTTTVIILFCCISILNIFYQDIQLESHVLTHSFGCFFLILITLVYLNQIDWHQNKKDPTKNFLFWLSWGLLLFHTGFLPIRLSYYFRIIQNQESYIFIRRLHLFLIPLMYCCFIIGFIKMRRKLIKE